MKILTLSAALFTLTFSLPSAAHPAATSPTPDLLTGDVRLACEATLCLSSGERPDECQPSLKRYFSIKHKKLKDTLKARKDFLKLCPASEEKNMPSLIDALVNGAGRCDAAELHRMMASTYKKKVNKHRSNKAGGNYFIEMPVQYIRNAKPKYCQAYFDHEWTTAGDKVKYIGVEKEGGRWVDVK